MTKPVIKKIKNFIKNNPSQGWRFYNSAELVSAECMIEKGGVAILLREGREEYNIRGSRSKDRELEEWSKIFLDYQEQKVFHSKKEWKDKREKFLSFMRELGDLEYQAQK